jgi:hypothetical protein
MDFILYTVRGQGKNLFISSNLELRKKKLLLRKTWFFTPHPPPQHHPQRYQSI